LKENNLQQNRMLYTSVLMTSLNV